MKIREVYGDKVRMVWKDFPLISIHPQAVKAAEAAHCAGDQNKYWEYHDVLFANQRAMQVDQLKKYAADLGLNAQTFASCLDDGKHAARVQKGLEEATGLGLGSTPSIFINGRLLMGAQPFEAFKAVIDEELQRAAR
jgi:protein-disulfide isomerase